MKINRELGLILAIIFLNPWIWKIYQLGVFIFSLAIILSLLIFGYVFIKPSIKILFLSVIALILMMIALISETEIDSDIWNLTVTERFTINQRRQLYPDGFGKLAQNKINLSIIKFKRNLFDNLDPNLYFFASHPQERLGINEFEKFPFILLTFFVIGFIYTLVQINYFFISLTLVTLLISSFIDPASKYGPILLFPIICLTILQGILQIIRLIKTRKLTIK